MEIVKTNLEGLLVIKSKCIRDNRGHFFESWNKLEYKNNSKKNMFDIHKL